MVRTKKRSFHVFIRFFHVNPAKKPLYRATFSKNFQKVRRAARKKEL
jgi:hypothetical protein